MEEVWNIYSNHILHFNLKNVSGRSRFPGRSTEISQKDLGTCLVKIMFKLHPFFPLQKLILIQRS